MIGATVALCGCLACIVASRLCHEQALIRDTDKWGRWAMIFAFFAGQLFVAMWRLWGVQGA